MSVCQQLQMLDWLKMDKHQVLKIDHPERKWLSRGFWWFSQSDCVLATAVVGLTNIEDYILLESAQQIMDYEAEGIKIKTATNIYENIGIL